MKKLLLGSAGVMALIIAGPANAGDLILHKAPAKAEKIIAPLPPPPPVSQWELETGMRFWSSTGSIGAPNPLLNNPGNILASRLLYKDELGISGELFGRLDHVSGFFVKGNAGLGRITSGNMYDEDFPAGGAYSNTLQNNNTGHLAYGTVDVGYNLITAPGAKIGAFIGYNYFLQHVDTFGCTQLAGAATCVPTGVIPAFFNGISEDDAFSSFRIGLSTQVMLTDRFKLIVDAAYLPFVQFTGVDNHNARALIINESSSNGDGVQFEAVLEYALTDNLYVGVGGRYWAWNMHDGNAQFNFQAPPAQFNQPARYNSERYGVFAQASYHIGDVTPSAVRTAGLYKAPPMAWVPIWSGVYIGGQLGGGVGNDSWSDPFPSNFIRGRGIAGNIAGFGDSTHAAGPLAGGEIGYNFQLGRTVYGVELEASGADIRGENTCFSGLGGVNCQRVVNAIATLTGRVGYTWDRSLIYLKAGGAWSNTTYSINGNTNALALGTGSANVDAGGLAIGGGLEYALNSKWSSKLEYDYLWFGSQSASIPTVALVGTQSVKQSLNVFKAGVNYRPDWGLLMANH
jgi:opacity protein-like surface antigen